MGENNGSVTAERLPFGVGDWAPSTRGVCATRETEPGPPEVFEGAAPSGKRRRGAIGESMGTLAGRREPSLHAELMASAETPREEGRSGAIVLECEAGGWPEAPEGTRAGVGPAAEAATSRYER